MFTANDLVEAAYRDDRATMEKCLEQNMVIDSRAKGYDSSQDILREYPFKDRFNKVHFAGWNSTWSNRSLENFTPLAAAIMGGHKHIVEFLLSNNCDVTASVKIYSFTSLGRGCWGAPFIDINMLGLSIITGNIEILNMICKQLSNQNMLVAAFGADMIMDNVYNSDKISVWEIPFKLNDDAILKSAFQFINRNELDISRMCRVLQRRCNYNIDKYPAIFTSMQNVFSKDEVIDEVLKQQLIWDCNGIHEMDTRENLIKKLDLNEEQIKTLLTQEVTHNSGLENTMLHNAVLLNSTYLVNKLLIQHGDANVNLQNKAGNTALHLALLQPIAIPEIIQCLIDHNASTGIVNNDDKTPLDLCRTPFLTEKLLNKRADVKNKAINDVVVTNNTEAQDVKLTVTHTIEAQDANLTVKNTNEAQDTNRTVKNTIEAQDANRTVKNTNEAPDANRTVPYTCCCLFLPQFISRRFTKQKATENVTQNFELPTERETEKKLSLI